MIHSFSLGGIWQFCADEARHFTGFPPTTFADTIPLPGTTAQAGKGTPNPKREDGCLTEVYPYKGNAWFRRKVQIPESCRGKAMELCLERTRITTLYVNGERVGSCDSLCTPHRYDLTAWSQASELALCICVDNASYPTAGGHMTSPDTQTNWNGITGEIALRFYDSNSIRSVRVIPDCPARRITLRMRTQGTIRTLKAEGEWIGLQGRIADIPPQILEVTVQENGECTAVMQLDETAPLWDEYSPVIGKLTLRPFDSQDVTTVSFGLSDLRADGHTFTSHGRPVFLRGKHDGMIFPLLGAAPTTVEEWLHVMGTAKRYGINHYRFHTCCPPDAAFTAADLLGIYMEPEIFFWGSLHAPGEEGFNPAEQAYLVTEGRRMLEEFGNHPSFCMFSLGNELWGSPERMGEILRYYKQDEHRILFTQGCNNFQFWPNLIPEDDYFVGVRLSADRLIRGSYGACDQPFGHVQAERPSTMHCYDPLILPEASASDGTDGGAAEIEIQYGTGVKKVRIDNATSGLIPDRPVVTHEIGQYVTYPDFTEIPKYTGVLRARNFEIFRERLEAAGMGGQAGDFFTCSGQLAVQCYKEELEAVMRSQLIAGCQILDIQDFTGQGTALVGILNAFMESKGLISEEDWRGFFSDSVLLGMFPDYCLTDRLHMQIKLRHYAPEPVHEKMQYTIRRGKDILSTGKMGVDVQGQGLFAIGEIDFVLPPVSEAQTITVTLQLPHTHNSYTFRQYPVQEMPLMQSDEVLCITHDLPEAMQALAEGGRVLFLPESLTEKVRGFYCADFWCYPMFRSISESMGKEVPVGTLGLCIDNAHPALQGFASEHWSTPQWYDLVTHSDLAVLDGTDVQPIVQMIDNFERNHKLGLLFECSVGQGRLLVCTARLDEITDRMEVRQFARGLLAYAHSDAFAPKAALTMEQAEKILR